MPDIKYIVDTKGNKKAVIIGLEGLPNVAEQIEDLLEDLYDLEIVERRRKEKGIPLEKIRKELERDGLI
ncbi:hypothetical protein J7M23_03970 [Candidatus Sumerlaeota bacterium]|nr:hypothetical protein [Candidatus Sumerlaeota bacterium]